MCGYAPQLVAVQFGISPVAQHDADVEGHTIKIAVKGSIRKVAIGMRLDERKDASVDKEAAVHSGTPKQQLIASIDLKSNSFDHNSRTDMIAVVCREACVIKSLCHTDDRPKQADEAGCKVPDNMR